MSSGDLRVVITGLGMITPLGVGKDAFWAGVMEGRSTSRLVPGLDPDRYPTAFACQVDDETFKPRDFVANRKSLKTMGRAARFAVAAAELAVRDAGLAEADLDPLRCGVVMGMGGVGLHDTEYLDIQMDIARDLLDDEGGESLLDLAHKHLNPLTPLKILPNLAAAHIAIAHGFRGENATVCTACTSGSQAVGEALRLMRLGKADVVLAGGADAMINTMGLIGFGMLGVLSRRNEDPGTASRPFDADRDGFVMGEGGVVLVLETLDHALGRGAPIMAELTGYGSCADAYRITDGREDGEGSADAMIRALEDAAVSPTDVQYVNAHGTGTRLNDRNEYLALRTVFGKHLDRMPVSSTKSQIGHMVAASGAVELAACVLALQQQRVPPTINHFRPDPECPLDVVPNESRPMALDTILSNSFGFGGQNACLVLQQGDSK